MANQPVPSALLATAIWSRVASGILDHLPLDVLLLTVCNWVFVGQNGNVFTIFINFIVFLFGVGPH
jgi:hypothetical protein